jgi:hypothetical protein
VSYILSNAVLYPVYLFALITAFIAAIIRSRLPANLPAGAAALANATVKRGDTSMGVFHGTFLIITGINLGIAQVVIPYLPPAMQSFSFLMMLVEIGIWGYLVYRDDWTRNRIIGLVKIKAPDWG